MPHPPSILQKRCAQANVVVLAAATLLLVWKVPGIHASPIQIRPSGEQYKFRAGKLARRRHLTEEDMQAIVQDYGLKEDAELTVQSISPDNTVIVNSKEYSLNGMSERTVRTKSFTSVVNGYPIDVPQLRKYYAMQDSSIGLSLRTIVDATAGTVVEVNVRDGMEETSLIALESEEHEDGLFVAISSSDYLEDPYARFDEGGEPIVVQIGDETGDLPYSDPFQRKLLDPCGTGNNPYYHIEVAITYDSTFCNLENSQTGAAILDGTPEQAIAKIEDIVFMASDYYENPSLCATLRLARTEGTCSTGTYDIYRTGIDTKDVYGILDDYTSQQKSSTAHRDVSHLFTGTRFTDGTGSITKTVNTIGLASTGLTNVNGVLCNKEFMYGIDSMGARKIQSISYNPTLLLQSILFAHELGHNCGAGHINNQADIMYPSLTDAIGGFSAASISTMRTFFQKTTEGQTGYFAYLNNCLANPDSANPVPAPSPTADDPKGDEPAPTSCSDFGFLGQLICWIVSLIQNLLGLS